MLTVKKLIELREILNLKGLCKLCDVNYYTIKNKTLFYSKTELTKKESTELQKSFKLKGLKLSDN